MIRMPEWLYINLEASAQIHKGSHTHAGNINVLIRTHVIRGRKVYERCLCLVVAENILYANMSLA